ncbi:hypothetical protein L1047_08010 [Synechococcus sp. Nb3U1]|uniref:hypothetical protein n=1 Tax=Synechococcus sp. Nb3U1 TaxID=1914529 RepID=UPI001F3515E4|nr:hypothetical protein [Synechococcus sp. Nb3U1]MCF2971136.1 hypothetical protein [Synechococcus sp. Nb3U1]
MSNPAEPTLLDVLNEVRLIRADVARDIARLDERVSQLDHRVGQLDERVGQLDERMTQNDERLRQEVQRWDERFFKFAEDSANRANTLIAGATISVIAGVILLLLRQ